MASNDPNANNTLGAMKARIADEIARDDLTSQIANAINDAIDAYQNERFYFNESRSLTFSTVINQEFYTASDLPDIVNIVKIDFAYLFINNYPYKLVATAPELLESLSVTATYTGPPYEYAWYDNSIRLYPIPNAVYPIRITAQILRAPPGSDGETGNVWMTAAERLIRSRAKYELAVHVLNDDELARRMGGPGVDDDGNGSAGAVGEALQSLRQTTKRITQIGGSGFVRPMAF